MSINDWFEKITGGESYNAVAKKLGCRHHPYGANSPIDSQKKMPSPLRAHTADPPLSP